MKLQKSAETIALILLFYFGAMVGGICQTDGIGRLTNKQFRKAASKENVIVLDVRTADEFKEGHIQNALQMDYLETETFKKQIQTLDTSKTYLLYCRSGKRSYNAALLMKEKGFKQLSDLKEGISEWDGPVVKGSQ